MTALLLVGAVTNGLLAGLFFAFSVAVGPGLRQVQDRQFVRTFQAVNAAILNPTFLTVFLAAPLAACGAALTSLATGDHATLLWAVLGAAGSVVTVLVTGLVNVPLNNRLAGAPTTAEGSASARRGFELRWNRWNTVRTLSSAAALVCLVLAGLGVGTH